jgi:hypothetical protein
VLFFEDHARLVLIVHAVLGAAVVATSTHLWLWMRKVRGGQRGRLPAVRWFAAVTLGLYVLQFVAGNVLYPTYKIRVRVEYLDDPVAQAAEAELRQAAHERAEARRVATPAPSRSPAAARDSDLGRVARLFDIKEHVVALGLVLAVAACALAFALVRMRRRAIPNGDGDDGDGEPRIALERLLHACALGMASCAWFGGIVGLYVSSFRSVGAVS